MKEIHCPLCNTEISNMEEAANYQDVIDSGLWHLYNDLRKLTKSPDYTDLETMEQVRRNLETLCRLLNRF